MGISSKSEFDLDNFLSKLHSINKYVKPTGSGSVVTVDQIFKFYKAYTFNYVMFIKCV